MEKIISNLFDLQNLTNNTIIFSQTIGKNWLAIIECQTPEENSIQLTIRFRNMEDSSDENNGSNFE